MKVEHRRTLERIFTKPVPTDIDWADIESMMRNAGVAVKERPDSRVVLVKDGEIMVVRRPHPKPLTVGAAVQDIARFLSAVGVKP